MAQRMNILIDTFTIKARKRDDLTNPITAALHNVAHSCSSLGHSVHMGNVMDDPTCVWYFGSITRRKMDTERAKTIISHRNNRTPTFALDSGLFSTYIRRKTKSSESNFFRVGFGDCVGTGDFLNANSTPERYEWFKKAYGFQEQTPTQNDSGPILFILQTERGWQYDNLEPYKDWARQTLLSLRSHTDRHIILRAHPNHAREPLDYIAAGVNNVSYQYGERARQSSIDAIRKASAVVTHSSSSAIEAYIEGIPTFALDERCLGYSHFSHDLSKIDDLSVYNWDSRYQNLCDWAMSTWHIEEFKNEKLIGYYLKKAKL